MQHNFNYNQKFLFLVHVNIIFVGRSTELKPYLNGVLTNPNCEFESNFVALHTLSTWWKSTDNKKQSLLKN